ncbi:M48 family metalloprotease [Desulfitibacter alkalitolerans]|uniref:M48 family metalloprotease n=1 Tax=Desulfitibacter alkalitolerans TaxID=264641 RepID=UPI000486BF0D|nr:M48 family metalloprotease [Desulfitibacter alkalitolerans]
MGIYQQIQRNKRNTLIFLALFIFLIAAVVYAAAISLDPQSAYFFVTLAFIFTLVGSFFSYYYSDKILLKMANARPVSKEREPYLYHTIEGVAIAAGIPTPKAYVIETDVPNAFATGRNPDNSAVAVTRGLMNMLNREELEGVVAHEMAHIKNYDILFATLVVVLAGTLVYLSAILRRAFFFGGGYRGNRRGGGKANPIIIIIGIITVVLAPIAAKIAQMAVSRNREYLADATAANMLGYPMGLASALEKLGRYNDPIKAQRDGFANEANAGLFIVNPLAKRVNVDSLFSTHPPIEKRVERLRNM